MRAIPDLVRQIYFDASLDPFKIEFLRPDELCGRIDACPVAFVPLGTLEWHGHHNPIGLDALKAHGVCLHAARRLGGGVVLPPCYDTGLVTPLYQKEPQHFGSLMTMHLTSRGVIEDTLVNLERTGFKVVLFYGGHYPAARLAELIARDYATGMEVRSFMERTVEATERTGDHAGFIETSLMMALLPDHVDLDRIRRRHPDNLYDDPLEGISESERPVVTANVEEGRALLAAIAEELAAICRDLLTKQGGRPTRVNYVGCT